MAETRMVAVCDVLGFSNLVLKNDLDIVLSRPVGFVRRALHWAIHKEDFPQSPPSFAELQNQDRIGFSWFSDTVLFYSRDDTDAACINVLETAAWLLFTTMTASDGVATRFRIGISHGEFHADEANRLFVGRSLVEAARLEANQAWAGGALSESAAVRIDADKNHEFVDYWITPYNVPVKNPGKITSRYAIDWTKGGHLKFDMNWSASTAEPPSGTCGDLVTKWRNTRQFHRDVCPTCFGRKQP